MSRDSDALRMHRRSAMPRLLTGGLPRPPGPVLRRARRHAHLHPILRITRAIFGWILIAVGLVGIVLPALPAVILIPAGVILVGRDARLVRWTRVNLKLFLLVAQTWPGVLGRLGAWLCDRERRFARMLRHRRMRRVAAGPSGT